MQHASGVKESFLSRNVYSSMWLSTVINGVFVLLLGKSNILNTLLNRNDQTTRNKGKSKTFKMSKENYISWFQRFDRVLQDVWLKRLAEEGPAFQDICTYFMASGGKRVRPCLVYAVAEDIELDPDIADSLAFAVEWIHQNTLVLDDLPAIDNDDLRHGKPSVHKVFGDGKAILATYGSVYFLYDVLAGLVIPPAKVFKIMQLVSGYIGFGGLTSGEWMDLKTFEQKEISANSLQQVSHYKTGGLFALCPTVLAMAKGVDEGILKVMEEVGYSLGQAFQVQDDLLTYLTAAKTLGKDPRSDQKKYKPTLVTLWGQDRAHQYLVEQYSRAIKLLEETGEPFGHAKDFIRFMQQRTY